MYAHKSKFYNTKPKQSKNLNILRYRNAVQRAHIEFDDKITKFISIYIEMCLNSE